IRGANSDRRDAEATGQTDHSDTRPSTTGGCRPDVIRLPHIILGIHHCIRITRGQFERIIEKPACSSRLNSSVGETGIARPFNSTVYVLTIIVVRAYGIDNGITTIATPYL